MQQSNQICPLIAAAASCGAKEAPKGRMTYCECGEPIELEMERDANLCVECICRESILRRMPVTVSPSRLLPNLGGRMDLRIAQ